MKKMRRLASTVITLIAVAMVVGTFVVLFNALAPLSRGRVTPPLLRGRVTPPLLTATPFPSPSSLEDIALGLYLQQHQAELNAPASDDPTPVIFTIAPGELPADVAARLQNQGLIKDADLFVKLAKYLRVGPKIQAGEFVLQRTMTIGDILEALQHARAKTVTVTIRPGWRAEEIAEYLATLGIVNFNKDQFLKSVKNGKYDFAFLRDRPKGAPTSLEGFLFPETYNVPFDAPVDTLINLTLSTFDRSVTDKMRQQAASAKMTLYEAVTLASIVEREAALANERPLIASVYLNRLKKKMFLQADPTVQYAMGYQAATKQWWKIPVTLDEYQRVDSPYNTYLYAGLPPGPICSPSLASIVAVLEPAKTDYLFFLGKGDGSHVFAKTYEEHQQNLIKYGYGKP